MPKSRSISRAISAAASHANAGALDLKRLSWNVGCLVRGSGRGRCPYEHLGPKLTGYDFWRLLPEEMSPVFAEAKANTKAKTEAVAA